MNRVFHWRDTPNVFSAYLSPANFPVKVSTTWSRVQAGQDGIEVLKRRLPPSVVPIRVRDPLPHLPMRRR
jgi:hypothetical protein